MRIVLAVLDALVVLYVVISVSRSFTAAYGLAENSSFNQCALLIFLVAIAIVARNSWKPSPGVASFAEQRQSSAVTSR